MAPVPPVMRFSRNRLLKLTAITEGLAFTAAMVLSEGLDITLFPLTRFLLRDLLVGTAAALPPLALFVIFFSAKADRMPVLASLKKVMLHQVKPLFEEARWYDLIMISVLAGFSEELLFRGVVQSQVGLVPASILFGLVHPVTPAYAAFAVLMGLYMGAAFSYFQSLLVPVQIHLVYDLSALIYLKYFLRDEE